MFTKAELTPHALELFRRVKSVLPAHISERLRSSSAFTTHSSYRSVFVFDVWDSRQTGILNRQHLKYSLGHDGRPGVPGNGYFHFWLNKEPIYRHRPSILAQLERDIPRRAPRGFITRPSGEAFDVGWEFNFPHDLSRFPDFLFPRYIMLISTYHEMLMPIIDQLKVISTQARSARSPNEGG